MAVTGSLERLGAVVLLVAAAGLLAAGGASAEPLDKDSCASLQAERKGLLTKEMQAALDQGPDWVKRHLNDAEIDRVRDFLKIEEKIEFRCRGGGVAKAKVSPPAPADEMPLPDRKPTSPASNSPATGSSQALADS
ncbi:MAG: hypothetical protein ACXWJ4_12515, partial [Methyloceanibacter sp.]